MFKHLLFAIVLMSSFLQAYGAKEEQKKPKEHKGIFSKVISKVESIPEALHSTTEEEKPQKHAEELETETKPNPTAKMPDPAFYDAIYPQSQEETSLLYLYNDKSSYENNHIPPVINYKYIVDDLFKMVPFYEKTSELLLIIDAIKNRKDVNLNKQDKFGNTLLHYAIRYHNHSLFKKLLLTHKINPNVCNFSYICPLHLSVYKGDVYEIKNLVEHGASLTFSNDRFEMPIVTAIKIHNTQAIYALAKLHAEEGISGNVADYIIYNAKQEGLEGISRDLYKMFIMKQQN